MLSSLRFTALLALEATVFATLGSTQSLPLSLLYQFPPTPYTNIENLAVRSNGNLVLNTVTGPRQYQLNPAPGAQPALTADITGRGPASLVGIAETYRGSDVFIVSAGNGSFGPQVPGGVQGIPRSFSVWRFDLSKGNNAVATQITGIPEANFLNGLVVLNKNTALITDSGLGAIWAVDITTGAHKIVIQSPLWQPTPYFGLGINGIKIRGDVVYWTNSALSTFGKVKVNKDGTAAGPIEVIASAPQGLSFDDFALDWQGNAWIAAPPNAVVKVGITTGSVQVVAGGGQDQTLLGPTSVALRKCNLYLTTGGASGQQPLSGQVFQGNICGKNKRTWMA